MRWSSALPDTEYLLCCNASSNNELAQVIFESMEHYHNPWQYGSVTPKGRGFPDVEGILITASQKLVTNVSVKKTAGEKCCHSFFHNLLL
jgi:hypothetical protein